MTSLFVFCVVSTANYNTLPDDPLAVTVRNSNRQSRDLVRAIHAKIEMRSHTQRRSPKSSPVKSVVVDWWQVDEKIRVELSMAGRLPTVALWKDGVLKSFTKHRRSGSKDHISGRIESTSLPGPSSELYDLWTKSLFRLESSARTPVYQLLQSPAFRKIESIQSQGKTTYKVRFVADNGQNGIAWFDPKVNYLVSKIRTYNGRDAWVEDSVTGFREVKPGLFFPQGVERRLQKKGKSLLTISWDFPILRINEPIDSSRFDLKFPTGTAVYDVIKGVTYVTGENEIPITKLGPPPTAVGLPTEYPTDHPMQSRPISFFAMALIGIGVLLAALGAYFVFVRFRANRR